LIFKGHCRLYVAEVPRHESPRSCKHGVLKRLLWNKYIDEFTVEGPRNIGETINGHPTLALGFLELRHGSRRDLKTAGEGSLTHSEGTSNGSNPPRLGARLDLAELTSGEFAVKFSSGLESLE